MVLKEQLERLVDEMVTRGVCFEDAQREFEKKFIAHVLTQVRRQPLSGRRSPGHAPQHAEPQDRRVPPPPHRRLDSGFSRSTTISSRAG